MNHPSDYSVETHGFCIAKHVLQQGLRESLLSELGPVHGAGRRGLLSLPCVADLARSVELMELVSPHLPENSIPVRAIFFDKSPESNWLVPRHQDLTLAVRERRDVAGFGPWSVKDGVPHVQPPVAWLEQMITIRLHLDDADETNGALQVLPGSHQAGHLSAEQIQNWRGMTAEVLCSVPAGGAMLMRPLLLHASSRSISERQRRILRIEYAAAVLPAGLQWHEGKGLPEFQTSPPLMS